MNETFLRVLILILVFASVLLLVETLVRTVSRSRSEGRAINLRLQMIGRGASRTDTMNKLRRQDFQLAEQVPSFLERPARAFERLLMAAGITMPTSQVLLFMAMGPAALMALIIVVMMALGSPIGPGRLLLLGTFAVAVGLAVPLVVLQSKAQRRRRKMEEQFPVALDVFIRGLRAGHPVAAALDLLTVEMPDPIGSQFGVVVDEVTYGADLRDALFALAERWDLDDMRMFVVSLSVQNETGGNLAEILENLSKVIRDRHTMLMKVRALSSEGRMTAVMLTLLPILAFTALFLLNPGFYLDVADDALFIPGFAVLILLYLTGYFTIRKMVDLKV
ncbi:type II secretion system F family protein [Sphingomonas arenae]|uniref:type II secretion system F family protein n=1 Tax=Sphingomonas arenae TaxID=2812555 RepID=UPI0019683C21|nr:type II secretion system F family protein [Sphingomonas arenae]